MSESLEAVAACLRAGQVPEGWELLKQSPVRVVARSGDRLLKLWLRPSGAPRREARALARALARELPVPALLANGKDWIATRWCEGRPARRADLDRILQTVERMHGRGVLHGDLHLGNVLVRGDLVLLLDVSGMRFLPVVPELLRRRELGYLAYSLGEPLPEGLDGARFWRDRRAHSHWRSRTRRAIRESSLFTSFECSGVAGFRRRAADPDQLCQALDSAERAELVKGGPRSRLFRRGGWILKEHGSPRRARTAWLGARGLESRGICTPAALACSGRWVVMEDAGLNLSDWVDAEFAKACPEAHQELARALGELLGTLHRRGIYHGDLKANNIAWSPGRPPALLDTADVRFRRRISRRRRIKNLAQLNAALPDTVPAALREAALAHYVRSSDFDGDVAALRREVIAQSLQRQHRWHGCATAI